MPRPNLRHSQTLIRQFCQQRDLPYRQTSLLNSYTEALRHLNTVGRAARRGAAAASRFEAGSEAVFAKPSGESAGAADRPQPPFGLFAHRGGGDDK